MDSWFIMTLLVLNLYGLALMGYDKHLARARKRRIAEASLFFWAVVGGALGMLLGMQIFRHKTQHPLFSWGLPLLVMVQGAVIWWYW